MSQEFDVVIIGGGPGGYPAAIRARQLGLRAALVEREHLGGICLNWGCIPTKALLRSSELHHTLQRLDEFGLAAEDIRFDVEAMVKRSRKVAKRLSAGVKHLLKKNEVDVRIGHARLSGPNQIAIETGSDSVERLTAGSIVIASGARSRALPGLEPDGSRVWTYKEAMIPSALPERLLIVGSGAIGMEFASFYNDLGGQVTVVEMLPQILPAEDEEISAFARKQFEKQGIAIHTGATVAGLVHGADEVTATIAQGDERTEAAFDRVILAVGIVGNVEDLGLEGTAVEVDRGHIVTDEFCATGEPGVFAIGDVAGPPWLAHKATHEGVLVAERIAGVAGVHPLDRTKIPGCTYCRPQIASVGFTETGAKGAGYEVRVGRFPFVGNGKAMALGESEGMVKTVFDSQTGELLGAHMVGAEVTELIQGFVVARTLETTEAELMQTVFAHPTLSEMMHESVLDAYGRALHI